MTVEWTRVRYRFFSSVTLAACLAFAGVGVFGAPMTVRAATVMANIFTDPDPGSCATTGTGDCSLREATLYANANPGTTIQLLAGTYTLTRAAGNNGVYTPGVYGTLLLTTGTIIGGAGASNTTIDASSEGILSGTVLRNNGVGSTIRGVTITGGAGNYSLGSNGGGAIYNDTDASLTIADSQITNNSSGSHGIVLNLGTMSVTNTTINGNQGYSNFRGGFANAAIENDGTFTLTASSVQNNTSGGVAGAAGIANGGTMTIIASTISGNAAFSVNSDTPLVGGITNTGGGMLTITNSTISGNSADSTMQAVGGVRNEAVSGHVTLNYVTVAGNRSGGAIDGVANASGAGQNMTLVGTLLSNTTGANCGNNPFTSRDYNLSSDVTCTSLTGAHDQTNTNPRLGPLADNGGPTKTQALLPGSPAIDAGGTSASGCPATDQRGLPRPVGAACDIGAYEVQVAVSPMAHPTAPMMSGGQSLPPAPRAIAHATAPMTMGGGGMPIPAPLPQPMRH